MRSLSLEKSKAEILIKNLASFNGVDQNLAVAIAEVESHFNELAARFEANWKYAYNVDGFAKPLNISADTERIFQMTSWGMMQVMGTRLRELGLRGNLLEIPRHPELGVRFGCLCLRDIMKKYSKLEDIISAYNAGTPKILPDGRYYNQTYVNKVLGVLSGRVKMVQP